MFSRLINVYLIIVVALFCVLSSIAMDDRISVNFFGNYYCENAKGDLISKPYLLQTGFVDGKYELNTRVVTFNEAHSN